MIPETTPSPTDGLNAGMYELSTRREIVNNYYHDVMNDVFLPSGRVTFLPLSDYVGEGEIVSLLSGERQTIEHDTLVDAMRLGSSIPSLHTRHFEVADGVVCVPPNQLPHLVGAQLRAGIAARVLRIVVLALLLFVAGVGCAADDDASDPTVASSTPAASAQGDTEPTFDRLPDRVLPVEEQVDGDVVLSTLCLAWRFDLFRDGASINDAVASLFVAPLDRSSLFDPEEMNDAVREGCEADSLAGGAQRALEKLAVTSPEIDQLINDACRRYAFDPGIAGQPGSRQFDSQVTGVLGLDRDGMADLVLDICGAEVFAEALAYEVPSISPDPSLTPGEFDSAFRPDQACVGNHDELEIPVEAAEEVRRRYDVSAADYDVQTLIPFSLGGTLGIDNLFPIAIEVHPGALDKPQVDQLVASRVCQGEITLEDARQAIVANWPIAYSSLAARTGPPAPAQPVDPERCVADGPGTIEVPDAVGLGLTDAAILMRQAGLNVVGSGAAPGDPSGPGAVVTAQEPAAHSRVTAGACIGFRTTD